MNDNNLTINARRSSLNLRMANLRRMMDKMVPRDDVQHVVVKEEDKQRFYNFIKNNRIPVAIRVDEYGNCEAVLIEENKGNNINNYTKENTSGYYVLEVMNDYNKLRRWIEKNLDYYFSWTIGKPWKSLGSDLEGN